MSTKHKNILNVTGATPSAAKMKFGIVVSEWNSQITEALLEGAVKALLINGCEQQNILIRHVPGTFELSLGAQFFAQYSDVDAVIALGCVIRGETAHFDYVCQGVTQGVTQLMLAWNMPVSFGVLTTENVEQAVERAGGEYGNKGEEAALTAIKMVALQIEMEESSNATDTSDVN